MPRSAHKYKLDKQRASAKEITPTKLDLETEDMHHHAFTQAEWSNMLIQEDEDEAVGEIMDELLSKVMEKCYKAYMEKQLAPFSVSWARSYITQTLEHQFLYIEEAGPVKACITEESEPLPAIPDSWAQGCVPLVHTAHQPQCSTQEEADSGCVPIQTTASVKKQHDVSQKMPPMQRDEEEINPRNYDSGMYCNVLSLSPPPKASSNKKQHVIKHSRSGPRKLLPSLSCSTTNNNVEAEGKKTECSADKQKALLHQHNNYKPIPKLDPLSLPRHWISLQYEIVDNTKPNPKKLSGPPRPEPKSNKQQRTPKPQTSSKDQPERFQRTNNNDVCLSEHGKERHVLSGPVKLESMVLAEGVSLLDPQDVEMKTPKFNSPSQSAQLKLIKMYPPVPSYSVDQVTAGPPPRVVPLSQSTNCNS